MSNLRSFKPSAAEAILTEISSFNWPNLTEIDAASVAWAYYYFSIQFRENLEIACQLFPRDAALARLKSEECDTANLSPYPGIAAAGEKLDHDEFIRRALALSPIAAPRARMFDAAGTSYLRQVRAIPPQVRALSINHYENGGLERLFRAMLQAPAHDNALLSAFRFFMLEHIRFDSDPIQGHGSLSRHMTGDGDILPLWDAFKALLLAFAPNLQPQPAAPPAENPR